MYEAPIESIITEMWTQVVKQRENDIYQAVQECGVTVDKEELVRALQYDRQQYEKGYEDGCKSSIKKFAAFLKDNSFLCDHYGWHSFQAIDVEEDLDDLVEEFLNKECNYENH